MTLFIKVTALERIENLRSMGKYNGMPVKAFLIGLNMLVSHENSCDLSHANKLVSIFIS